MWTIRPRSLQESRQFGCLRPGCQQGVDSFDQSGTLCRPIATGASRYDATTQSSASGLGPQSPEFLPSCCCPGSDSGRPFDKASIVWLVAHDCPDTHRPNIYEHRTTEKCSPGKGRRTLVHPFPICRRLRLQPPGSRSGRDASCCIAIPAPSGEKQDDNHSQNDPCCESECNRQRYLIILR